MYNHPCDESRTARLQVLFSGSSSGTRVLNDQLLRKELKPTNGSDLFRHSSGRPPIDPETIGFLGGLNPLGLRERCESLRSGISGCSSRSAKASISMASMSKSATPSKAAAKIKMFAKALVPNSPKCYRGAPGGAEQSTKQAHSSCGVLGSTSSTSLFTAASDDPAESLSRRAAHSRSLHFVEEVAKSPSPDNLALPVAYSSPCTFRSQTEGQEVDSPGLSETNTQESDDVAEDVDLVAALRGASETLAKSPRARLLPRASNLNAHALSIASMVLRPPPARKNVWHDTSARLITSWYSQQGSHLQASNSLPTQHITSAERPQSWNQDSDMLNHSATGTLSIARGGYSCPLPIVGAENSRNSVDDTRRSSFGTLSDSESDYNQYPFSLPKWPSPTDSLPETT